MSDPTPTEGLVLAITAPTIGPGGAPYGTRFIHVGPADLLLEHLNNEQKTEKTSAPRLDFYDSTGRRLTLVRDEASGTAVFKPDAKDPTAIDQQRLVDRIDLFQVRLQLVLNQKIAKGQFNNPPRQRVPRIHGELADVLIALDALAGVRRVRDSSHPDPDPGSFWHNLMHAAGWTHS